MSHRLELPFTFLRSAHLPRQCLLTGKTDGVTRFFCTLRRAIPPWLVVASYCFIVPTLYLIVLYTTTRECSIPVAPGAWSERRARQILPQMILVLGMIAALGFLGHALMARQPGGWEYACFSLSLFAGLGLATLLQLRLAANDVSVNLNEINDGIVVVFPAAREEIYHTYAKAFENFALDRPAVDAFADFKHELPREDSFVEEVPPGWDEPAPPATAAEPERTRRGPFATGVEIRLAPRPMPAAPPAAPAPPPLEPPPAPPHVEDSLNPGPPDLSA